MKEALITLRDVAFSYDGCHVACDLDFCVSRGDYLAIVGSNGSGKSTLVKGLAGLLASSKGKVELGARLKRRDIGYLPQQNITQKDFPASVFEVALSGCLNRHAFYPFYTRADRSETTNLLTLLGIKELRHKSFCNLSGGQQQRVLLARSLNAARQLLLLDEPAAGLDPVAQAEFYELIAQLNKDRNSGNSDNSLTIVMVSHDLSAALEQATHILHLDTHQRFFGTTSEYRDSRLGEDFIGCVHSRGHSESEHATEQENIGHSAKHANAHLEQKGGTNKNEAYHV